MTMIFEAGSGRHFDGGVNYMISEDRRIYAECAVPDGASEDYGYLTMKQAILDAGATGLVFPYDGQESYLDPDAAAACEVYTDIEEAD